MTDAPTARRALIVIDVQSGFDDPRWGPRDSPDCEQNIAALVHGFQAAGEPVVLVRHDSASADSPLHPSAPGNALKPFLADVDAALVVPKHVHSAFHGEVDLAAWLQERGLQEIVICGIQTNRCCETTARVGGDLGYTVRFVRDAMHTFDEPVAGRDPLPAELLSTVTAANIDGHFGEVVSTQAILGELGDERASELGGTSASSPVDAEPASPVQERQRLDAF